MAIKKAHGKAASKVDLKTAWQNYALSFLCVIILPLAPVILEGIIKTSVTEESLLITASVYATAIATASSSRLICLTGFALAAFESALYGAVVAGDPGPGTVTNTTILMISVTGKKLGFAPQALVITLILASVTLVERFRRHVRAREEFLEFLKER